LLQAPLLSFLFAGQKQHRQSFQILNFSQNNMINTTVKRPGLFLENVVFYFSFLLLALVVGAFFYVRHLTVSADAELSNLEVQIAATKTEDQKKLEDQIKIAQRQLEDFSRVISVRTSARDFFAKLESLIVPGVYLSKMDADFPKMSASFSGHGKNFSEVERQAMKFRSSSEILKSANLDRISVSEAGGVDFESKAVLNLGMKIPEYF